MLHFPQDLLSQVCHYSVTVRQEALLGLRDLFQLHESVLHNNLGHIIHCVAQKITDAEPTVRQSLLLLLHCIFPLIPSEKMAPFSALVSAHLSCAMTHIYEDIQLDSLRFLELCLRSFPELIAANSSQLLQNFVGLITQQSSTPVAQGKGGMKPGSTGKAMIVNPKGKLSSQKSRLKILQQLFDFLKALHDQSGPSHNKPKESNSCLQNPTITFSNSKPTCVQVFSHSIDNPIVSTLFLASQSTITTSPGCVERPSNIFSNAHDLQNFTQTIIPLLLECWMECNPVEMTTELPDNALSSLTVTTMVTLTGILKLLLQAVSDMCTQSEGKFSDGHWLVDNFLKDFKQHFMAFFPFASNIVGCSKKKGKVQKSTDVTNSDASVLSLNIAVCDIMHCFITESSLQDRRCFSWIQKLQEFVSGSLQVKAKGGSEAQQLQAEHVQSLTAFVHRVMKLSAAVDIPGLCTVTGTVTQSKQANKQTNKQTYNVHVLAQT